MNPANNHVQAARLDEALRNGWVEFWYQPKIGLERKELVGVETFARIRHPDLGILPAAAFMANVSAESATALSKQALMSALITSQNLREMGIINVGLAVNLEIEALVKLPIATIVRKYRTDTGKHASLIFDVPEYEVIANIAKIHAISNDFRCYGISLAIDDFGRSLMSLIQDRTAWEKRLDRFFEILKRLKSIQFAEMKLDRAIVTDCATDPTKQAICASMIGLAHNLGSLAVAVGIEKTSDLETLKKLGCDIGQGFLFGQPMSEETFIELLWEHAIRRDGATLDPTMTFERAPA